MPFRPWILTTAKGGKGFAPLCWFWHHQGMQGRSLRGVSVALYVAAPCLADSVPSVVRTTAKGGKGNGGKHQRGTKTAKGKGVPALVQTTKGGKDKGFFTENII